MANSLSLRAAETAAAADRDPAQMRLLLLGLNGLARAHEMSYFTDGHRAASLVAAHLLCEENNLPDAARMRIEQLFDLNWGSTALCKPFPEEEPAPDQVKKIGEALTEADGSLREVGHNAIFAMHAIKAFRMLPSAATPKRIEGVCQLIRAIKPWRDEAAPGEEIAPPKFTDGRAASAYVLREASAAVDKWTGHGQGFTGHMLTFGQSLVELAAMGDEAWAESCRTAFRKYVAITRQGPTGADKRIPDRQPSKLRPNQTEYWLKRGDKQVDIGHVFKYPYSYYDLLRRVDDAALKREWDAKEYRVF
jgi:hypothetical protein